MASLKAKLLLFILLLSCLSSFPFIYAQDESYWVELELGGVYGLRGETIDIASKTNYTGSNVRIYDPDDVLIYDQNWIANDTRQIPISDTAKYGTYRIMARVPEAKTEIWFTVLDITGWQQIPKWPHIVPHNNLWYHFNTDWTVDVYLQDDHLQIDFSTLRKLAKAYDMEVQALYNDMNFLIRFSKGIIKIDWNFAFIHSGAKIIINGTLDHARDISINFDAKKLKRWVTGLSSDQIVFDWSDVLGGEWWVYLPEDKELLIHAPQTFRIDPAIFSNGFEEGDFSAWTGTNGSPDVVGSPVNEGSYSARFNASGEYCYITFGAETTIYTRTYLRFNATPGANYENFELLRFEDNSDDVLYAYVRQSSGTDKLRIKWYGDTGGGDDWVLSDFEWEPSVDTWYCIEVHWTKDAVSGIVQAWIDDDLKIDHTGVDTDTRGQIEKVYTGQITSNYAVENHIDSFVVDTSKIGLVSANNAPSNDASSITNMDDSDNLYSQLRSYNHIFNVSDADGVSELDTILYAMSSDNSSWVNGTINCQTNAHSFTAGSDNVTAGSVTNVTLGNTANYTLPLTTQWDIPDLLDWDIWLWVNDTEGDDSGWDRMQDDYFDTVNDLVISGFACDDDRGDLGATLTFSGTVYYENNPGSGTATTFYPPDAEFTSVDFQNSTHDELGADSSIVNGAFSDTVTAENSAGIETYHAYIDMADADYTDADESPTDTFIADRHAVQTLQANATTLALNELCWINFTIQSEYDAHVLNGTLGDTATLKDSNGNTYVGTWNETLDVWEANRTEATDVTRTLNTYDSLLEANYTITVLNMNSTSLTLVWGAGTTSHTFDLRVVNSSGLGIEDCTVTLTNTTDTIFSVDTNSTGFIAQQSVDSGNYTLTITKDGYITYEHDYEINANIYWIIKLFTIEEGVTITNAFPLEFFGFMFAALGLMYYGWNQRNEENALIGYSLSFLFWIATIGQWVFDTSTDDNLIIWWVFLAPLILCALKIVEASLAGLERTEKTIGRY